MSKAQALNAIKVGDLIFGIRDDGQPELLRVYDAGDTSFMARNILNETTYKFGRDGNGTRNEDGRTCIIASTGALPPEQYDVATALERRIASKPEYPDTRLTEDEILLVRTFDKFFKGHLLPGTESVVEHAERLRAVKGILLVQWDPMNGREHPPALNEYEEDIPALVELLEKQGTEAEVTRFLSSIVALRRRPRSLHERNARAAISLVQLAQTWT